MNIKFTLDAHDFDGTHTVHQVLEHIGCELDKIITEHLRLTGNYQDDHGLHGGSIEIAVKFTGPAMSKANTAEYNESFDRHFKVLAKDRVELIPIDGVGHNPDNISQTELTYLQKIIDRHSNQMMAKAHGRSIETVRSHRASIYLKSKCKTPEELKIYCDKHKLLG